MTASASPLVHNFAGDREIAVHFSATAEVSAILTFEAELAQAQSALGLLPADAADAIEAAASGLRPEMDEICRGFVRDGVPVPVLVTALRAAVGEAHGAYVHLGATSQDAVDTGLMLRVKAVFARLDARLERLLDGLGDLAREQGSASLMARTRMQAALPFTVADKLATWTRPLESHRSRLAHLSARLPVQLAGPIGTGASFGPSYVALRAVLAGRLGLADAPSWQSDRTAVLDIAHALALLTGTLGKIGQDVALMAQTPAVAIRLAGGGTSSAMAHKQNPVGAEVLVALARLNAALCGAIGQSMVHENERSGAAWTLEWLALPQLAENAGAALAIAGRLLAGAEFLPLSASPP